MREILFRGKRKDNGAWVEGYYIETLRYNNLHWIWNGKEHIEIDPETVGQYTGLKDKNDKRIFEGDIVRIEERGRVAEGGIIVFRNSCPGGWIVTDKTEEASCSLAWRSCVEVIGNIHDNPELLEVE